MATEVLMPALSPTMTEGKIARWLKSEGEPVRAGDVLAEIETDKATMEVEAVDEGVLAKIVIPEGTDHVAVNTPIALIAGNGEGVARDGGQAGNAPPAGANGRERAHPEDIAEARPTRPSQPPAPAAPAHAAPMAETEYTGPTRTITVREALRDAIAEEMRRDETVFLLGEEVAEYRGPIRSARACCRNSARAGLSTPRSPSRALPGWGSGPGLPDCARSLSS